jgi:hypothetical protein
MRMARPMSPSTQGSTGVKQQIAVTIVPHIPVLNTFSFVTLFPYWVFSKA